MTPGERAFIDELERWPNQIDVTTDTAPTGEPVIQLTLNGLIAENASIGDCPADESAAWERYVAAFRTYAATCPADGVLYWRERPSVIRYDQDGKHRVAIWSRLLISNKPKTFAFVRIVDRLDSTEESPDLAADKPETWETHLFEYRHNGSSWGIQIMATSADDAKARVRALAAAEYNGVLVEATPALSSIPPLDLSEFHRKGIEKLPELSRRIRQILED